MNTLMGYQNFIPLLAPADITNATTASGYMDLKGANRAGFLVVFGNVHSGSGSDVETITVEGATDPAGTEAAVAFNYRRSGIVGTNTWGAVTAATTAGCTVAITEDGILLYIEVDPEAMAASDYRYVRVKGTATDDMANCVFGVIGVIEPKYKMTTFVTSTACGSS